MSGYWAKGIAYKATSPAIVVTIAMTIASRGRSTNTDENICSTRIGCCCHRACLDRLSRPNALEPFDNDLLAAFQPFDDDIRSALAARLYSLDHRFAVFNSKYVHACLVRDERGLRDGHPLLGLTRLDGNIHQLPVGQNAVRICHCGARDDRVRGAIDRDINEVDRPLLVIGRTIGEADFNFDVFDFFFSSTQLRLQE